MSIRARASWYFLSSAVAAAIGLVTLPLTTLRLGPEDYGVLALGTTIAGVGASVATLGSTYVISNRWQAADRAERTAIVSGLVGVAGAISVVWAAGWGVVFVLLRDEAAFLDALPAVGFALVLLGTVIGPWWIVGSYLLAIEGRAATFAHIAIAASVVTAAATLISLFAFDLDRTSLFVGVFAGGVVGFAGAVRVLGPYLSGRYDRSRRPGFGWGPFLVSSGLEEAYGLVERFGLARFAGTFDLGLYTHSQRYRQIVFQGTKAVGRGVWPVTLEEARDVGGGFPRTRRTWEPIHLATTAVGLAFVALGEDAIALLTNDKFDHAWVFLGPWFVLTLLQLSATPDFGVIYAFGRPRSVAAVSSASSAAAIVTAMALIPVLDAWGAVTALLVQAAVYRFVVRALAARHRATPFIDRFVVIGIVLLLGAYALRLTVVDGLPKAIVLFVASEAVCLLVAVKAFGWRGLRVWRPAAS